MDDLDLVIRGHELSTSESIYALGKEYYKARPWEMQYELSKETENWNGCYPDPNLGHGENWEKEEDK